MMQLLSTHSLFALPAAHTVPITGAPVDCLLLRCSVLYEYSVRILIGGLHPVLSPHINTATIGILISLQCTIEKHKKRRERRYNTARYAPFPLTSRPTKRPNRAGE
ncbi:hypothetical protein GGI42DRAFT_102864 [Trichoderma sp. SZMC 28013]